MQSPAAFPAPTFTHYIWTDDKPWQDEAGARGVHHTKILCKVLGNDGFMIDAEVVEILEETGVPTSKFARRPVVGYGNGLTMNPAMQQRLIAAGKLQIVNAAA